MRILAASAAFVASLHHVAAIRMGLEKVHPNDPAWVKPKVNPHRGNPCESHRTPPMCTNIRDQGFSAALVVSTFKEDLVWLNSLDWNGNITVYIHDRSKARSHDSKDSFSDDVELAEYSELEVRSRNELRRNPVVFETIPNKGDEASAYLSYIVTKYFKLPDVVFFVQGHRCAAHAKFDMVRALPSMRACFPLEKGYLDLNTYDGRKSSEGPHCKPSEQIIKHPMMGYQIKDFKGIWTKLFSEEYGKLPDVLCWDGYAQFGVKKELILRHPVSFYKRLFKGVVNGTTTMEFFWKMLFLPSAAREKDHSEEEWEKMRRFVLTNSGSNR